MCLTLELVFMCLQAKPGAHTEHNPVLYYYNLHATTFTDYHSKCALTHTHTLAEIKSRDSHPINYNSSVNKLPSCS